jgi:hypothetical protein
VQQCRSSPAAEAVLAEAKSQREQCGSEGTASSVSSGDAGGGW